MAQSLFHVTYSDKPHEEQNKRLVVYEGMTLTDAGFALMARYCSYLTVNLTNGSTSKKTLFYHHLEN